MDKNEMDKLVKYIRQNPVHMEKLISRHSQPVKNIPDGEKYPPEFEEENFFDENESITIYLDFLSELFPNYSLSPQQRCEMAKKYLHRHEFFESYYVYSGTCHCFVNNSEYDLEEGSFWIINTKLAHGIALEDESTNLVNILIRKSTFFDTILNKLDSKSLFFNFFADSIYNKGSKPKFMTFQVDSEIKIYLYKLLYEYVNRGRMYQEAMSYLLCNLFIELSRQYEEQNSPQNKLGIEDLLLFISQHLSDVTLKQMADEFHYSESYLTHFITSKTGMNFSKTVNHLRIRKSQELLCNTGLSIEVIANSLGYYDRYGFEKAFKKIVQLTPKQYRIKMNDG